MNLTELIRKCEEELSILVFPDDFSQDKSKKLLAIVKLQTEALKKSSEEKAWRDRGHSCESRVRLEAIAKRCQDALTASEKIAGGV